MFVADIDRFTCESIDEILGPRDSRFFGNGFRNVTHHIHDVHIKPFDKTVEAVASINYPRNWSKKAHHELKPHLSSIDALAISAQLNEAYLYTVHNVKESHKNQMWLRKCIMRVNTATQDLSNFSVNTRLSMSEINGTSLCGNLSHFVSNIGNISVEMVIDHWVNETKAENHHHYQHIDDLLGKSELRYYGMGYKTSFHEIKDVIIDTDKKKISTQISMTYPNKNHIQCGQGAFYFPFISPIDCIVIFGQLAQGLLYKLDSMERTYSNNLWMRRISFEYNKPLFQPDGFQAAAWMKNTKAISKNGKQWRTADFVVFLPSVEASYSVAHQLP